MITELHTCPCYGFRTLEEGSPGSFNICPVCRWEDDNLQYENPHYKGGANRESLYQAQRNFLKAGATASNGTSRIFKWDAVFYKDPDFKIFE